MIRRKRQIKIKLEGGWPVILCSRCNRVIKTTFFFSNDEIEAAKGNKWLPAQYCDKCNKKAEIAKNRENEW